MNNFSGQARISTGMKRRQFRWWHGVAFFAGVQLAQLGLRKAAAKWVDSRAPQNGEDDRESYAAMRLPVFAPPGWAFPVAWSINSACLLAGGLHVLNKDPETPGRTEFLAAQAVAWGLFATFDTAYFGLRSPINAALVTFAYSGATVVSLAAAQGKMKDCCTALSMATTVAWLALANPVAVAQAAWNRDPFWNTGPWLEPPPGWEKPKN
jgi:tryptophan-rich sensory protein